MPQPTDAELREIITSAMNDLRKFDDAQISMDSGVAQPTPGDPIDNMYGDLLALGVATCLAARRRILGATMDAVVEYEVTLPRNGSHHVIST